MIRIITNTGSRDSCHHLFKQLPILSLPYQYIYSLLVFVNKNRGLFQSNSEIHDLNTQYILSLLTFVSNNREQYFANSEIHNINTRHTSNLHLRRAHLNIYQKGVYYSGIKIFNSLPRDIKTYIDNPRIFKKAVKKILYTNSFYSLNEYYDNSNIRINL